MIKKKWLIGVLSLGLLAVSATPAMAGRYYTENYYGQPTEFAEIYKDNGIESNTIFEPITVHVDGTYLDSDVTPTIINGRVIIPLRAAGEALGAEITWDQATLTATAVKDGKTVEFMLNNNTYIIDGAPVTTDIAPTMVLNRTMLPLRAFAEAFDATVTWNQDLYDVTINTEAADAPAPNIPASASDTAQKLIQKYYVQSNPADPYVGSWRRLYTFPAYDNGYTYEEYFFITKSESGYSVMNLIVSDAHNGNPDEIVMSKDKAALNNNGLLVKEFRNDIFYSVGPYLGPINNIAYDTYHYYQVDDNVLSYVAYSYKGEYTAFNPSTVLNSYKF